MLEIAFPFISPHITALFDVILKSSKFAEFWKTSKIIVIYKGKGNRNNFDNYRPISLLSVLSKLFEKILFNRINAYLAEFDILSSNQFGFKKGVSTTDALLTINNHIFEYRNKRKYVSLTAIDLKKAFDTIDRQLLLMKLSYIGVKNEELKLFSSYLHQRKQYVSNGKNVSSVLFNSRGIAQGSTLGPLLFTIYMNDITHLDLIGKLVMFSFLWCIAQRIAGQCESRYELY